MDRRLLAGFMFFRLFEVCNRLSLAHNARKFLASCTTASFSIFLHGATGLCIATIQYLKKNIWKIKIEGGRSF
jgi:hypothetical protein